jgi:hypothetical protein
MRASSLLDKSRAVAPPGYNRWLVPPAALAIHLSIGQVYAFSVFTIPMSRLVQTQTGETGRDWTLEQLAWIFSIAIALLGISADVFGQRLADSGADKAMFFSACCFGGGFIVSARASGSINSGSSTRLWSSRRERPGTGLHLSSFDADQVYRPSGMATGLATGLGGGARSIPLATTLMAARGPHSVGLVQTPLVMGCSISAS